MLLQVQAESTVHWPEVNQQIYERKQQFLKK